MADTTTTPLLLQQLERDFSSSRKSSNKKRLLLLSVKDICCLRNKALPAAEVKKVLLLLQQQQQHDNSNSSSSLLLLDHQGFHLSFCSLLTQNLGAVKNALLEKQQQQQQQQQQRNGSNGEKDEQEEERSSVWYISKIATVFHFIQLLWEYEALPPPPPVTKKPTADDENNNAESQQQRPNSSSSVESSSATNSSTIVTATDSSTPVLTSKEVNKMVLQLLRSLTGVACTLCEQQHQLQQQNDAEKETSSTSRGDDHEDDTSEKSSSEKECCFYYTNNDASTTLNGLQIASYILTSMIRLNPYVRARPAFTSALWKSIGDVATALQRPIPVDIGTEAVAAIMAYLVEGTVPTLRLFNDSKNNVCNDLDRQELQQQQQQQNFQIKVLVFFLGRLSLFIKLLPPPQDSSSDEVQHVPIWKQNLVEILCVLRGIEDTPLLANKVERCLQTILLMMPPSGTSHGRRFHATSQLLMQSGDTQHAMTLLHGRVGGTDDDKKAEMIMNLASPFYCQGRCWLLLQLLQAGLDDDDDNDDSSKSVSHEHAETLFCLMENMLFCALPSCSSDLWAMVSADDDDVSASKKTSSSSLYQLLPRSMTLMLQILLRYETSLLADMTTSEKRPALHRLLACWLGRAEHPLARELILTLVHGHVQNLLEISSQAAAEAEPLVRLLAKILYDPRTKTQLRRSLACLFGRFLQSQEQQQQQQQQPTSGGTPATTVQSFAENILLTELETCNHLGTKSSSSSSGATKRKRNNKRPKLLTPTDMMVVGQVISMLPSDAACRRSLKECIQVGLEPGRLEPATYALLRSDAVGEEASTIRDLVMKFCKLWPSHNKLKESHAESLTSFGVALLRYLYKSCVKSSELPPPLATTVVVQAVCKIFRCIMEGNDGAPQPQILFEAIRVLRVISGAISSDTPSAVVEQLARIFHQLLSQKEWNTQAYTMSALVLFASSVSSAHQQVLPSCLPEDMAPLLQSRLKGTVHYGSTSKSDLVSVQKQCAKQLSSLIEYDAGTLSSHGGGSIFPTSASSMVVLPGSHFVRMPIPSDDGRTAIVIFQPGEQSIQDIHYMMEGNGEEPPSIQTLHRSQAMGQGGCKFYLKE